MTKFTVMQPNGEEHAPGSPFSPVLSGIAQGLAHLFPPIDNARDLEHDSDDGWQDGQAQPDDD